MKRSVIVVYAALLNTLLLPSVSDAEGFSDTIFKKLNIDVKPKTLVEWKKAFNNLAYNYSLLDFNYQTAQNKNKLFEKENAKLEEENAKLEKENARLENKLEKEKLEKNNVNSAFTIREDIEDVERRVDLEINYRSKPEMLSSLKNPETKFYVNFTSADQKEFGRLGSPLYENIHYIKWLYFLLTCDSLLANKIRNLLCSNSISIFAFCQTIDEICQKIGVPIPIQTVPAKLTPESLKEGLKLFGLFKKCFLDCAVVLLSINQLVGLFEGEFTPFSEITLSSKKRHTSE